MSIKSEMGKLIQAYAFKIFSARGDASIRTQQRFHDSFEKMFDRLFEKYGDKADMRSSDFWDQLQAHATRWWESRPVRGPGVDW